MPSKYMYYKMNEFTDSTSKPKARIELNSFKHTWIDKKVNN